MDVRRPPSGKSFGERQKVSGPRSYRAPIVELVRWCSCCAGRPRVGLLQMRRRAVAVVTARRSLDSEFGWYVDGPCQISLRRLGDIPPFRRNRDAVEIACELMERLGQFRTPQCVTMACYSNVRVQICEFLN